MSESALYFVMGTAIVAELIYIVIFVKTMKQASNMIKAMIAMLMITDCAFAVWTVSIRSLYQSECLQEHIGVSVYITGATIADYVMVTGLCTVLWMFAFKYYELSLMLDKFLADSEINKSQAKFWNYFMLVNILVWPIV